MVIYSGVSGQYKVYSKQPTFLLLLLLLMMMMMIFIFSRNHAFSTCHSFINSTFCLKSLIVLWLWVSAWPHYTIDLLIWKQNCYNLDKKHILKSNVCCEILYVKYWFYSGDCSYGDRRPEGCTNLPYWDCYNANTESKCCESCNYLRRAHLPDSKCVCFL